MARGKDESAWLLAKHGVAWLRGAWVKEPMPAAAMNPYYKKPPAGVRLRLLMEAMRSRNVGR